MRYHNITKDDMLNGDGLRVVLWVAGCSHCCRECQNPITWDPNGGLPFTDAERKEIFDELDKDYISGITFSGGDPLHPSNITEVTALAREIRRRYPQKTIWLYTGSLWKKSTTKKSFNIWMSALTESSRLIRKNSFWNGKAPVISV